MGVTVTKQTAIRMGRATLDVEQRTHTDPVPSRPHHSPRSGELIKVLVTESIAAATWSGGKGTPVEVECRVTFPHVDAEEDEDFSITSDADEENTIKLLSYWPDAVSISSGKARFGWAQDGELVNVSCTEFDLD